MFNQKSTEEIISLINESNKEQNVDVITDNLDINIKNDELTVKVKKEKNHTLEDLKQKLINHLYELEVYDTTDIEILKILFK